MIAQVVRALRTRAKVLAVAQLMVIRVVALAGNVCSGLLTAAFLGPDGRGEQAALIVALPVLASVCTLGLHASLIYNLKADQANGSRYFGSAMLIGAASGLAGVVVGALLLPVWLSRYSVDTVTVARLLLLTLPISVVTPMLMGVLEAHGRFRIANSVLYYQSLGSVALLVILAAGGWLTPVTAALSYVTPAIPSFFYLLVQARRVLKPRLTMAPPFPGLLLRFGLKFYGVDILSILSMYIDQLVIVFLLDPASVGAYAVALSLSRVLTVAQGAVTSVLFPSIAAQDAGSVVAMVARAARVTSIMNTAGAAALGIAGPSLLLLLYGTRFAAAVTPFLILLAEGVVTSAARTLAQAFSGTGHPGSVTVMEVAGVTTSIVAMVLLVPSFGIDGAAAATLLGGVVRMLAVLAGFRRILGIRVPPLVINRTDIAWMTGR